MWEVGVGGKWQGERWKGRCGEAGMEGLVYGGVGTKVWNEWCGKMWKGRM